jgi:hypothetical protein
MWMRRIGSCPDVGLNSVNRIRDPCGKMRENVSTAFSTKVGL